MISTELLSSIADAMLTTRCTCFSRPHDICQFCQAVGSWRDAFAGLTPEEKAQARAKFQKAYRRCHREDED